MRSPILTKYKFLKSALVSKGLAKLGNELCGAVDYTKRLVLILNAERFVPKTDEEEFDLSRFL